MPKNAMNPSPEAVAAALTLVDAGSYTSPGWHLACQPILQFCLGQENIHEAAARILAAEVRRLREPAQPAASDGWWCENCGEIVPPEHVTFDESHDTRIGGCGWVVRPHE